MTDEIDIAGLLACVREVKAQSDYGLLSPEETLSSMESILVAAGVLARQLDTGDPADAVLFESVQEAIAALQVAMLKAKRDD